MQLGQPHFRHLRVASCLVELEDDEAAAAAAADSDEERLPVGTREAIGKPSPQSGVGDLGLFCTFKFNGSS